MPSIFQQLVTGTHTGANNQATLTDAAASFVVRGVQIGDTIVNITDGSSAVITAVTATTITGVLAGGVENDWDTNDSYRVWATEVNRIRLTIRDTLGYPMFAEVTIANPNSTREAAYSDYRQIRILEDVTGAILFYGKVEAQEPKWDSVYGQVLLIRGRDNFQELLKRQNNTSYTGYTLRSSLIANVIANYSYSGNISTADATKFLPSNVAEPANQLDLNYDGAGKNALRVIAELANEDPWNATPTGFGFDYYLDTTTSALGAPAPAMWYFQRGSIPAGGASANGLTIQYGATQTDQRRSMLPDYSFPDDTNGLITLVRIEYLDNLGANQSLTVTLMTISGVVGAFTVGETITGGTSGTTATVQYYGTGAFLCISGYSGFFTIGETITGGSSGATATVTALPRQSYTQDVEVVIRGYDLSRLTEARDRSAQLLYHGGATIQRGEFTIIRWPYHIIGPTTTIVRTGHVVRVTNSLASIDQDMLVSEIFYDEGPGINHARISVLGTSRGKGAKDKILETVAKDTETALWASLATMGGLPRSASLVNLTNVFTSVDFDDITWGAGTATFSDGTTQTIDAGALNLPDATIRWIYITRGNTTLQVSTTFSGTAGVDNTVVAIAVRNATATERALVVSRNNGAPQLVAGTLIANQISAISADMGMLTAGAIRIPSGTAASVSTAGFTGFVLKGDEIAGYNAGTRQCAILSADGTFVAAAGALVLDATALHVIGSSQTIRFERATFDTFFFQHNGAAGLLLNTLTGAGLQVQLGSGINQLQTNTDPFRIETISGATLQLGVGGAGVVIPTDATGAAITSANFGSSSAYWANIYGEQLNISELRRRSGATGGDIGTSTVYWNNVYAGQVNTQDIRRISGAGGDIGTATAYFSSLYVGATRARITGSSGDMDFYVDDGAGGSYRIMYLTDGASPSRPSAGVQNRELILGDGTAAINFNLTRPKGWDSQSTVGAAGGASGLPATPSGYVKIEVSGANYVVPFYLP